jgi:hypothetical protein
MSQCVKKNNKKNNWGTCGNDVWYGGKFMRYREILCYRAKNYLVFVRENEF